MAWPDPRISLIKPTIEKVTVLTDALRERSEKIVGCAIQGLNANLDQTIIDSLTSALSAKDQVFRKNAATALEIIKEKYAIEQQSGN